MANLNVTDQMALSVCHVVDAGAAVVAMPVGLANPDEWRASMDRLAARGLIDPGRPNGKFLTDAGRAALSRLNS
jgi:hypothetical protein